MLTANLPVCYDFAPGASALTELYDKALRGQWVASQALPWATDVDLERPLFPPQASPLHGSDIERRLSARERQRLETDLVAFRLSQFLHGEQGALMAAAQLVSAVPDLHAKSYAATQVMDEARHVEVYRRYLDEKVRTLFPITPFLQRLLDLVLTDSRWDIKLCGMQIVIEGLALASFHFMREATFEPLLADVLSYVIGDESRHLAFGVLALEPYYRELPERERAEREDFLYEACVLLLDRSIYGAVWEKHGLPVAECTRVARESPMQAAIGRNLFARVVPAIRRVGLLSERQRSRFAQIGILGFENAPDPAA
jgi:hypothetical protein